MTTSPETPAASPPRPAASLTGVVDALRAITGGIPLEGIEPAELNDNQLAVAYDDALLVFEAAQTDAAWAAASTLPLHQVRGFGAEYESARRRLSSIERERLDRHGVDDTSGGRHRAEGRR